MLHRLPKWVPLFLASFLCFLVAAKSVADSLTIPNTFTAGTPARASEVNSNFTTITTWSTNIANDNIKSAANIARTKLNATTEDFILKAAGGNCFSAGVTGDTAYRASLGHTSAGVGGLFLGAGSASAQDLLVGRKDANTVYIRNAANNAYKNLEFTVASGAAGDGLYLDSDAKPARVPASAGQLMGWNSGATAITAQYAIPPPTGRLTLTSGTPVTTSNVTAATTVYFTPHGGDTIWLYTSSAWRKYNFTERSVAVPATTVTPFDVFIYDNAGTVTLETVNWTNDTTRATALATQDGVLVKTGSTNKIFLGTGRTTGVSGQTEDSTSKRYLFNQFNRVDRTLTAADTTNSWAYTTATVREANASGVEGTSRIGFVRGTDEETLFVNGVHVASNTNTGVGVTAGIGIDSTTAFSGLRGTASEAIANGALILPFSYAGLPGVGYHYAALLEHSVATGTTTWYGDNGGVLIQSGLTAHVRM